MPTPPSAPPSPFPPAPAARTPMLAVLCITVAALAARLPRVLESLWYDEIAAWRLTGYGFGSLRDLVTTWDDPAHHVFHTVLTLLSTRGLGDALGPELALRLPTLLASLAAVLALFAVTRRLLGTAVGATAAALMAFAPVVVLEGANARGYSLTMLFAVLAADALLRLRAQPTWMNRTGYALAVGLGIYTHLMFVFVPIGHTLLALWAFRTAESRPAAVRALIAVACAAVVTIALYAPLFGDLLAFAENAQSSADTPTLFGAEGLRLATVLGGTWEPLWSAAGLLLVVLGLVRLRNDDIAPARPLVAALGAGLPCIVLVTGVLGTWSYARFALFAIPGALLLMALGIQFVRLRAGRIGACIAFACVIGSWGADLAIRPARQPLRDAVIAVMSTPDPGRGVVLGIYHDVMQVYLSEQDYVLAEYHGRDIEPALATDPSWVIVMYPAQVSQATWDALTRAGFRETGRWPGWIDDGDGEVRLLRR